MTTEAKTESGKQRASLNLAQTSMITRIMVQNVIEKDGLYEYADGWNDERICSIVSTAFPERLPVNSDHVSKIRANTFPDWKKVEGNGSPRGIAGFMQKTVDRLAAIEARLLALEDATTKPASGSATNGVASGWMKSAQHP